MSANPDDGESLMRRGCFISGVVTVIVLIILREFLFHLPPLGMLAFAGLLWIAFFVFILRRGRNRRAE